MTDPVIQAKAIIVQTQEEERYRVARLLQAGPGQLLANAVVEIETCLRLMDDEPQTARAGLQSLLQELHHGLDDIRALVSGLQPPLLAEFGLAASLQKFTENFSKQTGIAVDLIGWNRLTERFPTTLELAIFRIVQEALENVRDHSHARRAEIRFEHNGNQLTVTISDNGKGFNLEGSINKRRLGVVSMRDHAELVGGNLQIFSEPGRGVRVVLTAPISIPGSLNS